MILEKDPNIFKERKEFLNEGNEKDVIIKLLEYHYSKKQSNNDLKWHQEKKTIMIQDLNYCMKVVCITFLKNVFSAIYPYFLNEINMQKCFKVK